jgi:hypothetical protein
MKHLHRFPASRDYIATEKIDGDYYIAYHLDYFSGEFDVDRIAFGHGTNMFDAIVDLRRKSKKC